MIKNSWNAFFQSEIKKPYFNDLEEFLQQQEIKYSIFPAKLKRFLAYELTPFEDIKVVILGQDPYHGAGQAHGLSFSVEGDQTLPPSLRNIFKELVDDIGCEMPKSGDLTSWAEKGVFLLNTVLSVKASEAGSHQKQGWETFTDATIKILSDEREGLVFVLWGKPAQNKEKLIDAEKHLVLKAPHPSPLSSYRGFFGSKPFSKANNYLKEQGKKEISWCL